MNKIISRPIIFGASGFIGQHFIQEVGIDHCLPVTRNNRDNQSWVKADLLDYSSIESVLKPGMTVFNLAYSQHSSPEDSIKMARNLVTACLAVGVSKLVHCSTAVVVGNNPSYFVDEDTVCYPVTDYEKTKFEIENTIQEAANDQLSIFILRPTGVIGPNGQNLKKMLSELRTGNAILNYIRSSIYGNRQLNLISVKDVVRALLHLSEQPSIPNGIYICSADDDKNSQYNHVESIMRSLLMQPSYIRPLKLAPFILNALLRVRRPGCGRIANRYYSSEKLISTGFKRSMSISSSIHEFVLSEQIS